MADPITPPKPAGKPGGFEAWLRTHQKQALLGGGAAAAVGIALYRRHQAAANGTSTTSTSVPAADTSAGGIPGSYAPYSGGGSDFGTPTGSDAVDTLNALAGLFADLPAAAPTKVTITNTVPKGSTRKPAKKPAHKPVKHHHPKPAPKPHHKPKTTKK